MGMVACIGQNEGQSNAFTGPYRELLAPLINLKRLSPEASKLFPVPATTTTPKIEYFVHSPQPHEPAARPEPQVSAAPLPSMPTPEPGVGKGATKPVLVRPGLIPGVVGTAALLLAVLPLDYSFYGLIRWVVFVSAIWLINVAAKQKAYFLMCCYIVSAVLWNPLMPFGFSRASWLVPDLMGAALMAYGAYVLFVIDPKAERSKPALTRSSAPLKNEETP
jgi:hypothetical protein